MAIGDTVMNVDEQVSGSVASAFVKLTDPVTGSVNRYNLFNLIDFESSIKVTTKTRGLLGRAGKVTYPTGWEGTWKATLSYNAPIFRDLLYKFKKTGKFPAFEIEVSNENTTGTIGAQTVIHTGCYIDSMILSKIDINADDELTEAISGTFNDYEIYKAFELQSGMKV